MTFGEAVEQHRRILERISEVISGVDVEWRLKRFHEAGSLDIMNPAAFAAVVLAVERNRRASSKQGRSPATNQKGKHVEVSLDAYLAATFEYDRVDAERSDYVRIRSGGRNGSFLFKCAYDEEVEAYQMPKLIRGVWHPRTVWVSRSSQRAKRAVDRRVMDVVGEKARSRFFGESYYLSSEIIESGLPSFASQALTNDGFLAVQMPEPGPISEGPDLEDTAEIAVALASNTAVSGRPADMPKRLWPTFPIDGVPIFRHRNVDNEPLYWLIDTALRRDLLPLELERLEALALRQASLDVPGPIVWLIEQPHVHVQLTKRLAHLSERIALKQLGPDRELN